MPERDFSVYGWWPHSQERWGEVFQATSARAAEDLAQMYAAEQGAVLRVAGVFEGVLPSVDRYTLFVDPRDVRNLDSDEVEPCVPELEVTTWTVLGLIEDLHDRRWNERTGGQRFCDHVMADSALSAEDVAADKVGGEGGRLLVCAVFAGQVQRADALYAKFSNPDVQVG
jgi:hypothetical protein